MQDIVGRITDGHRPPSLYCVEGRLAVYRQALHREVASLGIKVVLVKPG